MRSELEMSKERSAFSGESLAQATSKARTAEEALAKKMEEVRISNNHHQSSINHHSTTIVTFIISYHVQQAELKNWRPHLPPKHAFYKIARMK